MSAKKVQKVKENIRSEEKERPIFPARLIGPLADEIAKTVVQRIPSVIAHRGGKKKTKKASDKKLEGSVFFDTSAIIDGRIFDVIDVGLLRTTFVIPESILLELKHIADSQDMVKRERGRRGLERLEKLKKTKEVKVVILS